MCGLSTCLRDDRVTVTLGFVDHPFFIFPGTDNVLESGRDLLRGVYILKLNGHNLQAGSIFIKKCLNLLLGHNLNFCLAGGQRFINIFATGDSANDCLCSIANQFMRPSHIEQECNRIHDPVLNNEIDINNILVAGQHKGFGGNLLYGPSFGSPEADFCSPNLTNCGCCGMLDGRWKLEMQTR